MTTTPTILDRAAAEMRKQLANGDGVTRHQYLKSITLILRRAGRQWTLSIGAQNAPVDIDVAWHIARSFHIPPGTEPARRSVRGYHVLDLQWIEDEQPPLPVNWRKNPILVTQ
jgi:hypothetical protein